MNKTLLIVLMLSLLVNPAIAADQPYQLAGVVDAVYPAENRIVINDQAYYAVPYVVIHGNGNTIGMESLAPSTPAGFNLEKIGGKEVITDIWVLDELPGVLLLNKLPPE